MYSILFVESAGLHGVLLGDSYIHQITVAFRLSQVQPFIQLTIKTISKTLHLLFIIVHMITPILAEAIELLSILVYCIDPCLRANNSLIFLSIIPLGM